MEKYRGTLAAQERGHLEHTVPVGKAAARKLTHARILLLADTSQSKGPTDLDVVDVLGVGLRTVERVRLMNGQCLDRRMGSQDRIAKEVAAWERKRNALQARIHWTFTLAAARRKLHKLYPSIED